MYIVIHIWKHKSIITIVILLHQTNIRKIKKDSNIHIQSNALILFGFLKTFNIFFLKNE